MTLRERAKRAAALYQPGEAPEALIAAIVSELSGAVAEAQQEFEEESRGLVEDLDFTRKENQHLTTECLRLATENEIKEGLRQREKAMLAALPQQIFVVNSRGICRSSLGEGEARLLGPGEDFAGKSLTKLLPASMVGPVLESLALAFETRARQRCHIVLEDETGKAHPVEIRFQYFRSDHCLMILDPVGEHPDLVERLSRAQKMEVVAKLSSGLAHDLNNLLTVVLSHAQLLAWDLPRSNPLQERLTELTRAVERAGNLTRQLLSFGRKAPTQPGSVDLNESVTGLLTLVKRSIGQEVTLNMVSKTPSCPVRINSTQIDQVLLNLLFNARDAMDSGGEVTIETREIKLDTALQEPTGEIPPGRYGLLTVRDTGTGMDDETRERIFEPFFTTKEPGKGTGLGLANVHTIVAQSGGFLRVESTLGKGTSVHVYLPYNEG